MSRTPVNYYRKFVIPKRNGQYRLIYSPTVMLKIVQRWIAAGLQSNYAPPDHVFGFIPGRSHRDAASMHLSSNWVVSCDIENFFPSVSRQQVEQIFLELGYGINGANFASRLCCVNGVLAQGSPASPVISNIVFRETDVKLLELSQKYSVKLSRYADDIVFSGDGKVPNEIISDIKLMLKIQGWSVSSGKTHIAELPRRLKVHGLLVHGSQVRLTKGYRHKLRAYRHIIDNELSVSPEEENRMRGHLSYAAFIDGQVT